MKQRSCTDLSEFSWGQGCGVDSVDSGKGSVACSYESGDEPPCFAAMELVSSLVSYLITSI
jgi:hypothetical protein